MSRGKPRIALTLGDCAGIGPELVLHALNSTDIRATAELVVYGSKVVLQRVSAESKIPAPADLRVCDSLLDEDPGLPGPRLVNMELAEPHKIQPGVVQAACGQASADWISAAVADALGGRVNALVTAPINKEALHQAGVLFPGHTEMLAALCNAPQPCMAFFTPGLIIALATIHMALATVPAALNAALLLRIAKLLHQACLQQGIAEPRLGMLALNPHAGENGLFGDEEQRILQPAIALIRRAGITISEPLVPDTAFTWLYPPRREPPYHAYIAMYHDQALIPFKMVAFDQGVNVTLGLPIIRTSPDHGTAFDLAWQGQASPASFFEAIRLAASLCVMN
ncbi:MAG: 4-hydroxythreonine-4-phosphate dehydrogenase PdxA [Kiritimatiellae bacterium]|nr:4-hydroxythreonine-4-phosphate dehydrogenase PdxA [Kiritimatiellia bacterium]